MSDTCGNCDCTDRSQCTKKGNTLSAEIVEINETVRLEYEKEGDCKCGPDCACNPCKCGQ